MPHAIENNEQGRIFIISKMTHWVNDSRPQKRLAWKLFNCDAKCNDLWQQPLVTNATVKATHDNYFYINECM